MIESRKKVIEVCDRLFSVKVSQIVIDIVQDEIEELAHADEVTPDDIGALAYQLGNLLEIYNPAFANDIEYITQLLAAIDEWKNDALFANKILGIDPNK